ncbi:MAG: regulatory protein RecX [Pseudomonadota bacterium]
MKLRKRFEDEELILEQLDRLANENLQSDARYAESLVRQRYNRGQGPLRIRQEMRQKGIAEADIQAILEAGDFDWFDSASKVLARKFDGVPASDIKEKARRSRFMQYRGFATEHFQDLL